MRILIIEDEKKMAAYLKKGLTENGFIVDVAHNGQDGIFVSQHSPCLLIILDIMLPDVNGWTVLKRIRESGKAIPILMLTSRDSVPDKVKGLNLGADDYLVKPFSFSELLARINALLRRGTNTLQVDKLQIEDLEINFSEHKAWRNGERLNLTPKEFALLGYLARNPSQLLSRTKIAEHVWDMHYDSDTNIIDVAIKRLRLKIDDPYSVKLIHTVHGVGYVFEKR